MPTSNQPASKWKTSNYVKTFILAQQGLTNQQIAAALNVSQATFTRWRKSRPTLCWTLRRARKETDERSHVETFQEYVYERLSPEAKETWDTIHRFDREKNGYQKINALLTGQGRRMRQQLFIHALVATCFNPSKACRKVGVSKHTVDSWAAQDMHFKKLLDEMDWHKANFFESALIKLVKRGDVSATVFANKTFNRHRGYGDKQEIELTANINVQHSLVDINQLNLPLDTRKQILLAHRQLCETQQNPTETLEDEIQDAEYTVVR